MHILKGATNDTLLTQVKENINKYDKNFTFVDDESIEVPMDYRTELPRLDPSVDADARNAELIHKYLPPLTGIQASDRRLWSYLCHAEFSSYVAGRWKASSNNNSDISDRAGKINIRYFAEGNRDRRLVENAIARLWWGAELTYMPWERGDDFAVLKVDDPYAYTKVLFSNQELLKETLESRLCRSDRSLFAILHFFSQNPKLLNNDNSRNLVIELNRIAGVNKVGAIRIPSLIKKVNQVAHSVIPDTKFANE